MRFAFSFVVLSLMSLYSLSRAQAQGAEEAKEAQSARLQIATPYPLLADLARQIAAEKASVQKLPHQDIHDFRPTSKDLAVMLEADVLLLLGKGAEDSWLPTLEELATGSQRILLVGDQVSDLTTLVPCNDPHHNHGHNHDHHDHDHGHKQIDPHWWHGIDQWRQAAYVLSEELIELAPEHSDFFTERADALDEQLLGLKERMSARLQALEIDKPLIVVPHNAFGYLCEEFGLEQLSLRGIEEEQDQSARELAKRLGATDGAQAVRFFPEHGARNTAIAQHAESNKQALQDALYADGDERDDLAVIEFLEHNLATILSAFESP